jgi:hypothetical protein
MSLGNRFLMTRHLIVMTINIYMAELSRQYSWKNILIYHNIYYILYLSQLCEWKESEDQRIIITLRNAAALYITYNITTYIIHDM